MALSYNNKKKKPKSLEELGKKRYTSCQERSKKQKKL